MLNKKLIRKIIKHIEAEPKRLNMNEWAMKDSSRSGPPCGTTACVAGWALLLDKPAAERRKIMAMDDDKFERALFGRTSNILQMGAKKLGIDAGGAWKVFFSDQWPEPFYSDFTNATTKKKRTKITIARLEHLMETGE